MTHNERVLALLSDGLAHSHHEGYRLNVMLHSRVADLRKQGHDIACWREGDSYFYRLLRAATGPEETSSVAARSEVGLTADDPSASLPAGADNSPESLQLPPTFWERVHKTKTCWLWTGNRDREGYGRWFGYANGFAHRRAYEALVGPIPEGLVLDHLCRVSHCVNPDHLEAVTHRENILRGVGLSAKNARKTHCHRGHEFTPANTRIKKGKRDCRECQRLSDSKRREAKRGLAPAPFPGQLSLDEGVAA